MACCRGCHSGRRSRRWALGVRLDWTSASAARVGAISGPATARHARSPVRAAGVSDQRGRERNVPLRGRHAWRRLALDWEATRALILLPAPPEAKETVSGAGTVLAPTLAARRERTRTPTLSLRQEPGGPSDAVATSPPIIVRDFPHVAPGRRAGSGGASGGSLQAGHSRRGLYREAGRHSGDFRVEGARPAGAGTGAPRRHLLLPARRAVRCSRQVRSGAAAAGHRPAEEVHFRSGGHRVGTGDQRKQGLRHRPGQQARRLCRQPQG